MTPLPDALRAALSADRRALALRLDCRTAFVDAVLAGRRRPPDAMLAAVGWERVVEYRAIAKPYTGSTDGFWDAQVDMVFGPDGQLLWQRTAPEDQCPFTVTVPARLDQPEAYPPNRPEAP